MSAPFAAIALRLNTQQVDAGWWNILRAAGVTLESFFGAGLIAPTTFAVPNNHAAANITGLLLDHTAARSATIEIQVRRVTTGGGAVEVVQRFIYFATYNSLATAWTLTLGWSGGDDSGVDFSIVSATGQVQYTSDNKSSGTYDTVNSLLTFSARTNA